MTAVSVAESAAIATVSKVPLAHLSIEVGHLYMEDFARGPEHIGAMMRQVAPWAQLARQVCAEQLRPNTARVSTCFLVDDYFTPMGSPRTVIPQIIDAAQAAGVPVDYLAREASCATADGIDLASLVAARLVPDPPPGTNGRRPDVFTSGYLCNGVGSRTADATEAMRGVSTEWQPPTENGANRHSIFIDVQLWDDTNNTRTWSCPYLASVWQLLRLGLLRHMGAAVMQPRRWTEPEYPDRWRDLPPLLQLTEKPAPFSAFRTHTILAGRFLPIEHAVRTILSQVDVGAAIRAQVAERAAAERPEPITVPAEIIDRVGYAFTGTDWR